MAWKGVHISRPARLACHDGQLIVSQEDGEVSMPVEDVAWIVLDSMQVTLTAALVSACMEAGVAIIFSDARHTPSGMALPFHRHHRQAAVAALQLGATHPLKKRLWQALVVAKITNQAICLSGCGRQADAVSAMTRLIRSCTHSMKPRRAQVSACMHTRISYGAILVSGKVISRASSFHTSARGRAMSTHEVPGMKTLPTSSSSVEIGSRRTNTWMWDIS